MIVMCTFIRGHFICPAELCEIRVVHVRIECTCSHAQYPDFCAFLIRCTGYVMPGHLVILGWMRRLVTLPSNVVDDWPEKKCPGWFGDWILSIFFLSWRWIAVTESTIRTVCTFAYRGTRNCFGITCRNVNMRLLLKLLIIITQRCNCMLLVAILPIRVWTLLRFCCLFLP